MHITASRSTFQLGYDNASFLVRRGGVWQCRWRVPTSLIARLGKSEVRISTGARDKVEAQRAAAPISATREAERHRLLTGGAVDTAAKDFAAVLADAQALGNNYLPAV